MGIFSRLTDIVNSNIVSLLDRAEDPQKIIRLIIQEMEDTLVEVRSATVKAIADRKELERKASALVRDRDSWQAKAELAIEKGREDLAKGALLRKNEITALIASAETQLNDIEKYLAQQNEDIAKLQAKLDDAKQREATMLARAKTAQARLKTRGMLYDARVGDALMRMEVAERALDELDGRVEAYDIGRKDREPNLDQELATMESDAKIDAELAELKARLSNRTPAKE
ncbi:phage shock protein PspA [Dongia soli]|uniref:Phage shock protein PspA n=1 Tax=Dongia soli TaxID=600628 RepID=A0ABU5EA25_9PROT|nr:phage shock protein PspA [Dongia soli]MDY0883001.1 phage shock protein PspA [Dongia soli]